MQKYRCVPKIASPEALKNFYIAKRTVNVHTSIVVYLKWPRRRRDKKKQVDLTLKRSKLEKGARNEASLI